MDDLLSKPFTFEDAVEYYRTLEPEIIPESALILITEINIMSMLNDDFIEETILPSGIRWYKKTQKQLTH